jgi:uncharacterized protein (TIGR04255 family)
MKIPKYEWVQFTKSPLKLVVGQVRFTTLLRFEERSFIAAFQQSIRNDYPKISREPSVTLQILPTGISQSAGEGLWRLSSRDNLWSIVLGESSLTLESRKYSSMKDFKRRFGRILKAAKDTLEISDRLRLGLRYINEFRYPDAKDLADWRELFNSEFVGFDASSLLDGHVVQMLQDIQLHRSDGTLAIRHGLLNGFAVAPLPQQQPDSGRFYYLDLDYSDMTECELDIQATLDQMQEYNNTMYDFFRWTLGETLYQRLEPHNAQRN